MFTNPKLTCQIITAGIAVYIVFHLLAGSIIQYHSFLLEKHRHRTSAHPLQKVIAPVKNKTVEPMTYYEFHSEYYDPYEIYI